MLNEYKDYFYYETKFAKNLKFVEEIIMRIKNYLMTFLVIASFTLIVSCDAENGIAPKDVQIRQFGFGGNIIFYGVWPDSIKRVILVAFKDPLLSVDDFVLSNIGYLSFELPLNIQAYRYSSLDSAIIPLVQFDPPPSIYHYVGIAQQSTEILSLARRDWFVTGVYYANGDTTKPGILTIPENAYVEDINIYCDFDNPPPQPPGGN